MHKKKEWIFRIGNFLWKPDFPAVMGILNLTPDSFYAQSRTHEETILKKAERFLEEGASILDIGAQSTRPGSQQIGTDEEWQRLATSLQSLRKAFPDAILSVDTYNPEVARRALDVGASMINDVSGGEHPEMVKNLKEFKVPLVLMHKKGNPETMQQNPFYEDVLTEVLDYFLKRLEALKQEQIVDVMLDPGFGFGKNLQHNITLLNKLAVFESLGKPLLVGISRKKMVRDLAETDLEGSLNATGMLHMYALNNGASLLRVHDVKEAAECVRIWNGLSRS